MVTPRFGRTDPCDSGRSTKNAIMVENGLEGVCTVVRPLGDEEASRLSEDVL